MPNKSPNCKNISVFPPFKMFLWIYKLHFTMKSSEKFRRLQYLANLDFSKSTLFF
jgi:hypothetical protein